MTFKYETVYFPYVNLEGRHRIMKVNYQLWFHNNQLVEVRNEHKYAVEASSACWEYFNDKYNNNGKI